MLSKSDLAEIEAIKRLKAAYLRCVDTKRWTEWRMLFTDDFVMDAPGLYVEGADAFVADNAPKLDPLVTVHHAHMPEITLAGPDSAKGIWSMEDVVTIPNGPTLWGYGHYHEEYRKQGGMWRFARIRLTRLRVDKAASREARLRAG